MSGEYIPTLLDQTDPATLCFRSHQDALDFARHSVEKSNRALAANNLINVVERYRKGDIQISAKLRICASAEEFNFVIFAIIPGCENLHADGIGPNNVEIIDANASRADGYGNNEFMLWRVGKLVECPEGVIPSFVALEPFKESTDFRRQILAAAFGVVPHVGFSWPEGELGGFGVSVPSVLNGDGKSDLVQNGPEVVGCVEGNVGQVVAKRLSKLDFVNICAATSFQLNDFGPWLIAHESVDLTFEFTDVLLCPTEHRLGADEQVCHGAI
jgi:hypothetical protein